MMELQIRLNTFMSELAVVLIPLRLLLLLLPLVFCSIFTFLLLFYFNIYSTHLLIYSSIFHFFNFEPFYHHHNENFRFSHFSRLFNLIALRKANSIIFCSPRIFLWFNKIYFSSPSLNSIRLFFMDTINLFFFALLYCCIYQIYTFDICFVDFYFIIYQIFTVFHIEENIVFILRC